ncbi:metalloregulator ArsR/SmtB family transcription factor [Gordonia sp. Z-3]|jgi:DNA-binding transcriptional ArsR family regulator|uniref:Metalloregulator ArsR/SmtB family transcription factor n=2 Tax=Gordonia TaxID=2053 RepID=A0A9X3D728_9ACTN|nr:MULTISPECIES: metalloregulator ArsR/SmtB family transcription factor [Gordonia]MAQ82345.1 transcriptional regulator [Maritimibacter sp.]MAU84268.1 transcriptional regulator [Gordonia sp. (in: high G+C Gram-positive bacteria)]MCF3937973.1 metalloregulator ArsR/SmtB family transcription factor [Gordonia tangerina]MCX2965897.1 metalloregulator ArsR/SmtB family transcription factor [Gordonia aquimaris]MED5800945.1 metalloregulator ArsR/SmtB family transcription factor [Gordonia sp. Z-3]
MGSPERDCAPGADARTAGPAAYEAASDLLRALASPTRVAIVLLLRERPQCVHEVVGALSLSQPLVSQHLRVLKDAGVVRGNRSGREIVYELVDDHLAHIVTDALTHAMEPSSRIEPASGDGEVSR